MLFTYRSFLMAITTNILNQSGITGQPGLSAASWYSAAGAGGAGGSSYSIASSAPYTSGTTVQGTLTAGDVVIDGVSLKDVIKQINERLLILTPDLEKMEKYAALKAAYDDYKLLEAMIGNDKDTPRIE